MINYAFFSDKELKYLLEPLVFAEVSARRGHAAILPCVMRFKPPHYRVKWTKLEPSSRGVENIVLITNGHADKQYGSVGPRATLLRAHALDVSLRLSDLELEDDGSYRCELINGIDDESVIITLRIEGRTGWQIIIFLLFFNLMEKTNKL